MRLGHQHLLSAFPSPPQDDKGLLESSEVFLVADDQLGRVLQRCPTARDTYVATDRWGHYFKELKVLLPAPEDYSSRSGPLAALPVGSTVLPSPTPPHQTSSILWRDLLQPILGAYPPSAPPPTVYVASSPLPVTTIPRPAVSVPCLLSPDEPVTVYWFEESRRVRGLFVKGEDYLPLRTARKKYFTPPRPPRQRVWFCGEFSPEPDWAVSTRQTRKWTPRPLPGTFHSLIKKYSVAAVPRNFYLFKEEEIAHRHQLLSLCETGEWFHVARENQNEEGYASALSQAYDRRTVPAGNRLKWQALRNILLPKESASCPLGRGFFGRALTRGDVYSSPDHLKKLLNFMSYHQIDFVLEDMLMSSSTLKKELLKLAIF